MVSQQTEEKLQISSIDIINVAENLSNKITNKNTKFQEYLKNPNKSSLLKETTPDEIRLIINE